MPPSSRTVEEDPSTPLRDSLQFGKFRIDLQQRALFHDDKRVRIQRKPLAVLIYLIQEAPRLVPREELLEKFWSKAVNEESLTRCISTIRKLLNDTDQPPQYLETHRAQGYRFVAEAVSHSTTPGVPNAGSGPRRHVPAVIGAVVVIVVLATAWFLTNSSTSVVEDDAIDRIAVLPVAVGLANGEWLEQALTDHVMRTVSVIEGVTVVAATRLSDDADIQANVARLGVDALLHSRLEQAANGSKLSAQLVSVASGELLWQSSFESVAETVGSSQVEELARQLAMRLRPALQLREQTRRVDEQAYALYLRGRYFWSQRSAVGLEAAISAFEKALEIEPDYEDAMLGAAESWLLLPLYGAKPPIEVIPSARALAQQVLAADPENSRARAVLGSIAMQYDWDWLTAERLLREAATLNPNDATAQQWLGELFCYTARFDECRHQLKIAFDLDPLSLVLNMQQGSPDLYSGNYDAAVAAYTAASQAAPDFAMLRYALGLALTGQGDWSAAIDAYESSLPDLGLAIVGGPMIYALYHHGQIEAATSMLAELEELAESRYVPPSKLAVAYLGIGDRSRAIAALQLAVELHDDRLVYFAGDVHFRDLLPETGFREIAARIGLLEAR